MLIFFFGGRASAGLVFHRLFMRSSSPSHIARAARRSCSLLSTGMLRFHLRDTAAFVGNLSRLTAFPRVMYERSFGPAVSAAQLALPAVLPNQASDMHCANRSCRLAKP